MQTIASTTVPAAPAPTLGLDGPYDAMLAFSLGMARHGMSVSSRLMEGNREYALAQLSAAHALGDTDLQRLALELFRRFEPRCARLV